MTAEKLSQLKANAGPEARYVNLRMEDVNELIKQLQTNAQGHKESDILSRPECPFNYCDQPAPFAACKDRCHHGR